MTFGIPPKAHWQAEEFQRELKRVREMALALRWPDEVFESPEEVAAWLRASGFRADRPVDAALIRHWMSHRRFPWTYMRGGAVRKKFLTTKMHVLAWLFSMAQQKPPKSMRAPKSALRCPL